MIRSLGKWPFVSYTIAKNVIRRYRRWVNECKIFMQIYLQIMKMSRKQLVNSAEGDDVPVATTRYQTQVLSSPGTLDASCRTRTCSGCLWMLAAGWVPCVCCTPRSRSMCYFSALPWIQADTQVRKPLIGNQQLLPPNASLCIWARHLSLNGSWWRAAWQQTQLAHES